MPPPIDSSTINASVCPLCGEPNRCAAERERVTGRAQPPCWCVAVRIDAAILGRIAPAARGRACICAACAQAGPASPN